MSTQSSGSDPLRLADSDGYNQRELNRLTALVEQHEDLFQERWRDHFSSDNPSSSQ